MKISKLILSGAVVALGVTAMNATADEAPFMRSSIYSILVNSAEQNTRLDQEAKDTNAEAYEEAIGQLNGKTLADIPTMVFPTIQIPEQFNNHNLTLRVLEIDTIMACMTPDEAKAARPKEKGGGFGKFMKSAGAAALSSGDKQSSMVRVEKVDDYMHGAVQKYFTTDNVAAMMVAKWYNYDANRDKKFNTDVIAERGYTNASAEDIAIGDVNSDFKAALSEKGFELMNNTFVVATNLRFRNNQALAKEIGELAGTGVAVAAQQFGGGAFSGLAGLGAKKAAEAATNKLMKDQYSVTAVTHLYKLDWNEDLNNTLGEKILYNDKATLDDLIKLGVCKLTYVGQTKARSGVKKDKNKTLEQLAATATERAMDMAYAKLQVENEVFRTKVPISKCEDGYIYVKIGSKEGLMEGDEYDILEQGTNEKTQKHEFKKVGSAKVVKGNIWFNTVGADEIIANTEDEEEATALKKAASLGYTILKSNKKNDYTGFYVRLAKKKGKLQDQ